MSEIAADRPWWEDVQHLRPQEGEVPSTPSREEHTAKRPASGRFQRRPGWTTATAAEAPTAELAAPARRSAAPDFDFDIGLASLLDKPAEEPGRFEWIDLSDDDAAPVQDTVDWLALEEAAKAAPSKPLDARTAQLTADDKASGWRSDVWDVAKPSKAAAPARRRPPRSATERFAGRPDRIALYAFILGLLLIALAALGAPTADAAVL